MRIVGKRRMPPVGLHGPTQAEIDASVEASRMAPWVIPRGVYRYRSHAEANADMDRWTVEAIVARQRELAAMAVLRSATRRRGLLGVLRSRMKALWTRRSRSCER